MNSSYLKRGVCWLFGICFAIHTSGQQLAVSNNLVYDATLTPNLGLEIPIDSAWTAGVNVGFRPWPADEYATRKHRHLAIALHARRWTGDSLWHKRFYGFNVLYAHYNLAGLNLPIRWGLFKDARHHRVQGDLWAVGGFYGYAWDLGSRFSLELEGGLNLAYTHYERFGRCRCAKSEGTRSRFFILPQVGLNIVYRLGNTRKAAR